MSRVVGGYFGVLSFCLVVAILGDRLFVPAPVRDPYEAMLRQVSRENYDLRAEADALRVRVAELEAGLAVSTWRSAGADAARRTATAPRPVEVGPGDRIPATDVPVR